MHHTTRKLSRSALIALVLVLAITWPRSDSNAQCGGGQGALTAVTSSDESAVSANFRHLVDGLNTSVDLSTPGKIKINASGGQTTTNLAAVKPSPQDATSTTLIDDNALFVSIPQGTYAFELLIFYQDDSNGTADLRLGLICVGTGTGQWSSVGRNAGNNVEIADATLGPTVATVVAGGSTATRSTRINGIVQNTTASPGTLKLQFAKNATHSNPVRIMQGSYLLAFKL